MPESFFSLGFMIYPEVFKETLKIFFSIGQVIGEGECDSLVTSIRYLLLDILYLYTLILLLDILFKNIYSLLYFGAIRWSHV